MTDGSSGHDPTIARWNEGHNSAMEMMKPIVAERDKRIEELTVIIQDLSLLLDLQDAKESGAEVKRTLKATSDARIAELEARCNALITWKAGEINEMVDIALKQERFEARNEALEEAAKIAYMVCANTRHVTLGETAVKAIHALKTEQGEG